MRDGPRFGIQILQNVPKRRHHIDEHRGDVRARIADPERWVAPDCGSAKCRQMASIQAIDPENWLPRGAVGPSHYDGLGAYFLTEINPEPQEDC